MKEARPSAFFPLDFPRSIAFSELTDAHTDCAFSVSSWSRQHYNDAAKGLQLHSLSQTATSKEGDALPYVRAGAGKGPEPMSGPVRREGRRDVAAAGRSQAV